MDTIKTATERNRMDCDIKMKVLLISNPTGAIREISLQDKRFPSSLNYSEFFYAFSSSVSLALAHINRLPFEPYLLFSSLHNRWPEFIEVPRFTSHFYVVWILVSVGTAFFSLIDLLAESSSRIDYIMI